MNLLIILLLVVVIVLEVKCIGAINNNIFIIREKLNTLLQKTKNN